MNASFELKEGRVPDANGNRVVKVVPWIRITTGVSKDEVHRIATPADLERYSTEFNAFRKANPKDFPEAAKPAETPAPAPQADVETSETDAPRGFAGFRGKQK